MRKILTLSLLILSLYTHAGDILVSDSHGLRDALRQAREWRRTHDARCEGGITIRLENGRYQLCEPLFLRPEDCGTPEQPLTIVGNAEAVICGDVPQQHTQLWPKEGMERMKAFNTKERTITIPTPPKQILEAKHVEMVVHQRWAIAILRVKEMKVSGAETVVSFMEPESRLEFEHPWPQPVIGGERGIATPHLASSKNSSFLLRTTEQRDGIEQLVIVDGASHVTFSGITFENTCWNRPLHKGHVTLQGGFPLIDAYKLAIPGLPWDENLENQAWVERPVSAVTVRNASQVNFQNCSFRQLAATALDYADNISNCTVSQCIFKDIGGTAIMAGSFAESPMEVHRPYKHLAARCHHLTIKDNSIDGAAQEDWGAVAIGCGYVRDVTIAENCIENVNYSGICVGWGWTPLDTGMEHNRITGNRVSGYARQLYDAGGIYTLSNQPGSVISGNMISAPYPAPYATNDRGFRIYLDARTDGFTIENNRTYDAVGGFPADTAADNLRPIQRDEIGDNNPGPNIIFRK